MNEKVDARLVAVDRWEQALTWHSTLRDSGKKDLTDAVGRQWQHWCADAENRQVFDDVSRLLADHDLYDKWRRPTEAELSGDQYDLSIPIADWRSIQARQETKKERSTAANWWWWLSAGIGVVTVSMLFILWSPRLEFVRGTSSPAVFQTDVGGLKDVHLSDGSSVVLGGRTKVAVAFSRQRRAVTLLEGQAWFKVAHEPHWPFMVAAGDGTITDVGTAFLVTRDSDRVVVTVTEGAVEVSARSALRPRLGILHEPSPKPILVAVRVIRGEELAIGDNGALSRVNSTDPHAATAWTHGRLIFDDQPLRYVIETIDRYSSRHIAVSPSAGALRFSGIVFSDQITDWLQSLEVIFPVTVEERGRSVRIETRQSIPAIHERPRQAQP